MKKPRKKYVSRVSALCLCGRPAIAAGEKIKGGGCLTKTACLRCAEIESRLYSVTHTAKKKEPRPDAFSDVRRACERWLRERGLSTATGHHYIDYLPA